MEASHETRIAGQKKVISRDAGLLYKKQRFSSPLHHNRPMFITPWGRVCSPSAKLTGSIRSANNRRLDDERTIPEMSLPCNDHATGTGCGMALAAGVEWVKEEMEE